MTPKRAPRYVYPRNDWPFAPMVYEMPDGCGGLWLISPEGDVRQVSRQLRSDAILSDVVFEVVPEDAGGRKWLCGRYGVAVLDRDNRRTGPEQRPGQGQQQQAP